jgi:MFS family permease
MTVQNDHSKIDRNTYIAVIIGSCIAYSGLYTMPLWIGAMADYLQFDPAIPGYMGSFELLMAALASIWVSGKIASYSAAKMALWGAVLILTASLLSAIFTSVPLLFLCRGLAGIGEGILLANLNVTISRTENPDRLFAISQTTIALFGISLFATAPILMTGYGLLGIFGLVVLTAVLALLTAGFFPAGLPLSSQETPAEKNENSFAALFTSLPLLALGILFIGCQGGWAYLERMGVGKAYTTHDIGQFIMIGLVISLLGPFAANRFSAKFGHRFSIVLGLAISGLAVLLASQDISTDYYKVSAAIFPFATLFIVTSFLGYLARLDVSGKLVASAPAFINLGGTLGPAFMGLMLSAGGYPFIGITVIITYLIAAGLLLYPVRKGLSNEM